jgi:hypothetical protein
MVRANKAESVRAQYARPLVIAAASSVDPSDKIGDLTISAIHDLLERLLRNIKQLGGLRPRIAMQQTQCHRPALLVVQALNHPPDKTIQLLLVVYPLNQINAVRVMLFQRTIRE